MAPCSAILDGLLAGIVEQFRDVFGPVVFEIQSLRLVDMPQPQLTSTNLNQPQATSTNLNRNLKQPQAVGHLAQRSPKRTLAAMVPKTCPMVEVCMMRHC